MEPNTLTKNRIGNGLNTSVNKSIHIPNSIISSRYISCYDI